ncbi:hypothetical protein C3L33_16235, partial [Rhododendron williamsianum]
MSYRPIPCGSRKCEIPLPCGSRKCETAKGIGCMGCTLLGLPRPGCTNDTCGSDAYNPIKNLLYAAGLGEDVMEVYSTDGQSTISSNTVPDFPFSCGLAPSQEICPLSPVFYDGIRGHIHGGGPYYMLPYTKDLSKSLATTPLLINPVSTAPSYSEGDPSDEYFIDVKLIRVNGIRLGSFNASLLAIDKQGNGGTKLSTVAPHTVLQSSIYESVVNKFVKTAALKKIKRVASVSPFGACFDSKTIGALCLGLVDGGAKPRTSVVLGGHQLENYLVEFDLERGLKMVCGAFYKPKVEKSKPQGDNAYFICTEKCTIGVADGVGGWSRFGVDAGQYARDLMANCVKAIRNAKKGKIDPRWVLDEAYKTPMLKDPQQLAYLP